jgi:hypothetical protein
MPDINMFCFKTCSHKKVFIDFNSFFFVAAAAADKQPSNVRQCKEQPIDENI